MVLDHLVASYPDDGTHQPGRGIFRGAAAGRFDRRALTSAIDYTEIAMNVERNVEV
jgi:hypothetical protein